MKERLMDIRAQHGQLPPDRRDPPAPQPQPPTRSVGQVVKEWMNEDPNRTIEAFIEEFQKTFGKAVTPSDSDSKED